MEWWQRSVSSNLDIKGECNLQKPLVFRDIDDTILYLTDQNNSHTQPTLDLIKSVLPNVNVDIRQIDTSDDVEDVVKNLPDQHMFVLGQWHLNEHKEEIDRAFEVHKNLFFVFSAGNSNTPFEKLSPLSSDRVVKIGSYNRSGNISSFCNQVNCDYYFPGTSIKINGTNYKGTSYAAVVAVICFLVLKHKHKIDTLTNFRQEVLNRHVLPLQSASNSAKRIIINKVYLKKDITPERVVVSDIAYLKKNESGISFYLDHRDVEIDKHKLLIDAIGDAIEQLNESDIIIPMSGGIDSESIAQSCVKKGISFTPLIMRYVYDGRIQNQHDYMYAEQFCKEHRINPEYITLNLNKFLEEEEYLYYVNTYYTGSPQMCCHLWMLDQLYGYVIMPGDPPLYKNDQIAVPKFNFYCYDYYIAKTDKKGIMHMFLHNEEIVNSCIAADKKCSARRRTDERKYEFYSHGGYCVNKTRPKQTGFENIRRQISDKYNEEYTIRMFDKFFRKNNVSLFPIDQTHKIEVYTDTKFRKY